MGHAGPLKLLTNPGLHILILRGCEGGGRSHIFHENKAGNGLNPAIAGRVVVLVNVAFQPVNIGEGLFQGGEIEAAASSTPARSEIDHGHFRENNIVRERLAANELLKLFLCHKILHYIYRGETVF